MSQPISRTRNLACTRNLCWKFSDELVALRAAMRLPIYELSPHLPTVVEWRYTPFYAFCRPWSCHVVCVVLPRPSSGTGGHVEGAKAVNHARRRLEHALQTRRRN